MKKIIGFSSYLNVIAGGAELSTLQILNKKFNQGHQIEIVSFQRPSKEKIKWRFLKFHKEWVLSLINIRFTSNIFQYFEYLLNRKKVIKFFELNDKKNRLITYGKYAPAAIQNFPGKSEIYFRCEDDFGINRNYHYGFKRIIKSIIIMIEYPALIIYKKDLKIALKKSKAFCNSKFMQQKLFNLYGVNSEIKYPSVNRNKLLREYHKENLIERKKGIVFIDGDVAKGSNIALKVAKNVDSELFYFFSKKIKKKIRKGNVVYLPWSNSAGKVFSFAKLVIVPSIWEEAFGRVSKESKILGIPVLVSNIGGLPESVDYDNNSIVKNFQDANSWIKRIKEIII